MDLCRCLYICVIRYFFFAVLESSSCIKQHKFEAVIPKKQNKLSNFHQHVQENAEFTMEVEAEPCPNIEQEKKKKKKTQDNDQEEKPRTKRHLEEVKEISTAHPSFLISWPLKAPLTVVKNNWKYKV